MCRLETYTDFWTRNNIEYGNGKKNIYIIRYGSASLNSNYIQALNICVLATI